MSYKFKKSKKKINFGKNKGERYAATMAADLWHDVQSDLPCYCRKACHVHRLHHLHYDDDIRFALRIDICNLVPQLINDSLYVK